MKIFVLAVTTGFALAMGSAIFKKVAKHIGLDDDAAKAKEKEKARADADQEAVNAGDGATDPGLRSSYS